MGLTIPENVEDALKGSFPDGFMLIGKCANGELRAFLYNPKADVVLATHFALADCNIVIDNEEES